MSVQTIATLRGVDQRASVNIAPSRRRAKQHGPARPTSYAGAAACKGPTRPPALTAPAPVQPRSEHFAAERTRPTQRVTWQTPAHLRAIRRMSAIAVGVIIIAIAFVVLATHLATAVGQVDAGAAIIVNSGDTLWTIASSHAGEGDVREVVAQIISLNDLTSTNLKAGQTLLLPAP
ncbi:MAG: LysM peptidoglycan-binding domain-containing protein [Bowdeniella nasicola]|nr:LysM peptidoglycan-binding domain-containing protein [Bowdeniella nasicola]